MKKEYTPFGEFFSKLREKRKEKIQDAAKILCVSIAYISSVEHGDREIPFEWIQKIIKGYKLNEKEQEDLKKSYFDTPSMKKISLSDIEKCMTNMIDNLLNGEERDKAKKELKRRLDEFRK